MHFEWPWALGALLLLPLVAWRQKRLIPPTVVFNRSGSMRHTDFRYGHGAATRLDVVKTLSLQFIFGNRRDLPGRPSEMIGLIEFAGDPITLSPLTLSHDHLSSLMQNIQPASGDEDGTAIGDAVALAAARFKEA